MKKNWNKTDSYYVLDSFVKDLIDPIGAGDALIAYATLSMVVSKNHAITSIISSIAASLACEKEGNTPIKISEILAKINSIEKINKDDILQTFQSFREPTTESFRSY